MRDDDSGPGRGRRSLQTWSRLSAARRALEARGEAASLEEVLREAGLDASLIDVLRTELVSTAAPAPEPAREPDDDGPVVRENGRISLRIV